MYTFEDFCEPIAEELPENASLRGKVIALEEEVADLKARLDNLQSAFTRDGYDGWFRRHISRLADEAGEEFVQKLETGSLLAALEHAGVHERIRQTVEAIFEREANELAKSVFSQVLRQIQPYALKQR
jgi:hypothetical protein